MVNVTHGGELFECNGCGNVIEVKRMGGGELMCCGQAMSVLAPEPNTQMEQNPGQINK